MSGLSPLQSLMGRGFAPGLVQSNFFAGCVLTWAVRVDLVHLIRGRSIRRGVVVGGVASRFAARGALALGDLHAFGGVDDRAAGVAAEAHAGRLRRVGEFGAGFDGLAALQVRGEFQHGGQGVAEDAAQRVLVARVLAVDGLAQNAGGDKIKEGFQRFGRRADVLENLHAVGVVQEHQGHLIGLRDIRVLDRADMDEQAHIQHVEKFGLDRNVEVEVVHIRVFYGEAAGVVVEQNSGDFLEEIFAAQEADFAVFGQKKINVHRLLRAQDSSV